ncbi:M12 family metallo-peptidase [Flavobacterium wongokense]|uniref:M12 family metallo-peptidase n=1 Tax=Flavobacterium wongokense TaxID=2910674 RepID=UPI001F3C7758|nr:M12 family metallo-peptidase [Flavobacterium sp. WG47]MCF6131585.1 M12 family metallo-peptidase [Flavobacterium sp. WG47]
MKKCLLLTALFCLTNLLAQNKVGEKVLELQRLRANFKPISVLVPTQDTTDNDVDKVVDGATLATINLDKVNEIVSNKYSTIELQIPYQNRIISVLLYQVNPFVEGFHVDTNKKQNIAYEKGVYYRGIIKGETKSVSAFNFFNGEFNGIISDSELGNVVVGKLVKLNNQTDYIVYSDAKMKVLNDFDCHVKDDNIPVRTNGTLNRDINSAKCVSMYFEVDYNIFEANGSSEAATIDWMTSVFNNVQTLYNNDGITVGLKSIFIWTDFDPYEGIGDSSGDYLNAFPEITPVFDGDVGQLVGIDPGGLGGVAVDINGLCTENNYSYSDVNFNFSSVPTYSWTVQVITHEFGHLLGSRHTHACVWNGNNTSIDGCGTQAGYSEGTCPLGPIPSAAEKGTIMSYCHLVSGVGISLSNGFGPQPALAILTAVNGSGCLSSDCTTSCPNTVTEITTSNITPTEVTIGWTDVGSATSWQVAVTPFASSTIVWNTATTNSYTVSGLNPNTYYKIRVRPLCAGFDPASRTKIFATTTANWCSSVSFTDTGGTTGNYTNMESWVRTMTPYNIGLKLRVTFLSFNLESNYDYLQVINGPTEFHPPLSTGLGLTGVTNPGQFNSTAADGSLTFKFTSDQGVVASGWNATITCTGTLGVENTDFLDYSYYPNPTTGRVTITSKDAITEVTVYNVQGQLLYTQKLNELTTNVDISQFATGTYFFKLKINDREANFKVVKM